MIFLYYTLPLVIFPLLTTSLIAFCFAPPTSPVFPTPNLTTSAAGIPALSAHLDSLIAALSTTATWQTNTTSFSVQLSSTSEKLWAFSHTAGVLGDYEDSPPLEEVDEHTVFRIASISKVFATLSLLLLEGRVELDAPVSRYIPELAQGNGDGVNNVDWEGVTIRSMASQMSGIVRDFGQGDVATPSPDMGIPFDDPIEVGFPPVDEDEIPPCNKHAFDKLCTREQLLEGVKARPPMFAPNFHSSYSNLNFIILGLVIKNVTGKEYEDVVAENIFEPLGMSRSSFEKPLDHEGAIPPGINHWRWKEGISNPTGGIYCTSHDLSRLGRAILTSELMPVAKTNAWLKPTSYSRNQITAYGMPWEVLRSDKIVADGHSVDLYTKDGGLMGYYSSLILIPEYGLVATILVAGDFAALQELREAVVPAAIRGVESIVRQDVKGKYEGVFEAKDEALNSSIEFVVDERAGVKIGSWISNGTDILQLALTSFSPLPPASGDEIRMTPTGLEREGAVVWRWGTYGTQKDETIFGTNCHDSLDNIFYASRSMQEVLVWLDEEGVVEKVGLPAYRVVLERTEKEKKDGPSEGLWEEL